MNKLKERTFYTVDSCVANGRRSGECITDSYWFTLNGDPVFYVSCGRLSQQCNKDENVCNILAKNKMYAKFDIEFIPIVFTGNIKEHAVEVVD